MHCEIVNCTYSANPMTTGIWSLYHISYFVLFCQTPSCLDGIRISRQTRSHFLQPQDSIPAERDATPLWPVAIVHRWQVSMWTFPIWGGGHGSVCLIQRSDTPYPRATEFCSVAIPLVEASIGKDVEIDPTWPRIGHAALGQWCDSTTGGLIQYGAYTHIFKTWVSWEVLIQIST
jgi:hypothetical protein